MTTHPDSVHPYKIQSPTRARLGHSIQVRVIQVQSPTKWSVLIQHIP